jgi:predicted O-methyltransferase YrrM
MKQSIFMVLAYLRHLRKSGPDCQVNNPFISDVIKKVIQNQVHHEAYSHIGRLRARLLQKTQVIESTDFGSGAGNKGYKLNFVRVASIVKNSAVSERCGMVLFRLVEYFKPKTILELGTSVGISTIYLAMANRDSKVITLEGCATKSEQAAANFNEMKLENIVQHIGRFDVVLPQLINETPQADLVFIDGNHTYEATISNFNALLKISHPETIFVFDDIHWSAGMQKAWGEIADHDHVTLSIDLFRMGIIFLRKDLMKQKLVIRI